MLQTLSLNFFSSAKIRWFKIFNYYLNFDIWVFSSCSAVNYLAQFGIKVLTLITWNISKVSEFIDFKMYFSLKSLNSIIILNFWQIWQNIFQEIKEKMAHWIKFIFLLFFYTNFGVLQEPFKKQSKGARSTEKLKWISSEKMHCFFEVWSSTNRKHFQHTSLDFLRPKNTTN